MEKTSICIPLQNWWRVGIFAAIMALPGESGLYAQPKVRIRELTDMEGRHQNVIRAVGLVTGLNGTGGDNPSTRSLAMTMLDHLGQRADALRRLNVANDTKEKTDNISAVMVTAVLDAGRRPGQTINATVSAIDNATSLDRGVLIPTPLTGPDGEVYAIAAGRVRSSGFSQDGQAASVKQNNALVGSVDAVVEKQIIGPPPWDDGIVLFSLKQADLQDACRIADSINDVFVGRASALGPDSVAVRVDTRDTFEIQRFLARVQEISITPSPKARVVIADGTVVIGEGVTLASAAITHGNITVTTTESPEVSQPAPFADGGETVVVPRTQLDVTDEVNSIAVLDEAVSVRDLANALNALGVSPKELGEILTRLHDAGALHADVIHR